MNNLTTCFYTLLLLTCSWAVKAQEHHPHHLFIKMKKGEPLKASQHIQHAKNLIADLYLVKTNNLEELLAQVSHWEIEYLQKDHLHQREPLPQLKETFYSPHDQWSKGLLHAFFNDEFSKRLWAFDDKWGMSVAKTYQQLPPWGPAEVIVAVVDTGVDYHHEDLRNIMWKNSGEIAGDGIDNDGNGYIDDIYGINTLVRTRFSRRTTTDPMASHWHGTHVAGTIAAEINNGIGITGVAHNVKIMAIRSVPDNANESDSDIIESFLYAARNGARIINCSFGKTRNDMGPAVSDIINSIGRDFGVLVVAASGNNSFGPIRWYDIDAKPQYPASFDSPYLLTVASTNSRGKLSEFSNIGQLSVDLAAPGSNIFSTVNKNKYAESSGTSMATPNASGAAAMLLGYFPELTAVEIKDILMKTVKKSKELEGKMKAPGVINLEAAMKEAQDYRERRWP